MSFPVQSSEFPIFRIKIGEFWTRIAEAEQNFENKIANMRKCLTKFKRLFECGAAPCGAKVCRSCRSRQKLSKQDSYSNEYLIFTCKFGVDTAENGPLKVYQKLAKS